MSIQPMRERSPGTEENGAVVRACLERVYSKGELSLVDRLVAADFVGASNDSAVAHLGSDGVKAHVVRLRRALGGLTIAIADLHLTGTTFEASWTARGVHERRFLGVDPTLHVGRAGERPHGNRLAVPGVTTGTMANGKIATFRMNWDLGELRRQLAASVSHGDAPAPPSSTGHVSDEASVGRSGGRRDDRANDHDAGTTDDGSRRGRSQRTTAIEQVALVVGIYGICLYVAAVVVGELISLMPGLVGAAVLFTLGLAGIAAAPSVADWVVTRPFDSSRVD